MLIYGEEFSFSTKIYLTNFKTYFSQLPFGNTKDLLPRTKPKLSIQVTPLYKVTSIS